MEVAVISQLMTLSSDSIYELGPPFCVWAEQKKRRADSELRESVEDTRSRVGIRPVVERQRHAPLSRRQATGDAAEHRAVAVKEAMSERTRGGKANQRREKNQAAALKSSTSR